MNNAENENKIIIKNEQGELFEVLSHDKLSSYSLVYNHNRKYTPYIVVSHINLNNGTWGQGHYFTNLNDAYAYYKEIINEHDKNYYKDSVKYLIKEELSAIGIYVDKKQLEELFEVVVMNSNESKILNTNIIEEILNYKDNNKNRL